jgi:integrase
VSVHPILAAALIHWRDRCRYREPEDWVFANEHHRGRHPYWGQVILRRLIRPVAERIGIKKWIDRHTFRHTYSTRLRSVGTELKSHAGAVAAFVAPIHD